MRKTKDEKEDGVHIRWMIRRDLPVVLAIESTSFETPWSEAEFIGYLRERNVIGMVCEEVTGKQTKIVGFMVYALHKGSLELLNMAVDEAFRRKRVGAAMISKLKGKLYEPRRTKIETVVKERNLPAQQFFRNQQFRCVELVRSPYRDCDDNGFRFVYRIDNARPAAQQETSNRISMELV